MPSLGIKQQTADLRLHPGVKPPAVRDKQYTIGDLHGNAIKLIRFLTEEGILHLSAEQYQRLHDLYHTPNNELTAEHFTAFENILTTADWTQVDTVRLIGDVFADRGNNDYFTLLALEQLEAQGIPTTVLYSNHDAEFIRCMHLGAEEPAFYGIRHFGASVSNMLDLIKSGVIKRERVMTFWQRNYAKHMKAFDYLINDRVTPPVFTLLSHAPVGLETVRAAARKLGVRYQDGDVYQLANTIDLINARFQHCLRIGDFSILDIEEEKRTSNSPSPEYPFLRLCWNRAQTHYTEGRVIYDESIDLPLEQNGYRLQAMHGHSGERVKPFHKNRLNIDTDLGKSPSTQKGKYLVAHNKITPAMRPKAIKAALSMETKSKTDDSATEEYKSTPASTTPSTFTPDELSSWLINLISYPTHHFITDDVTTDVKVSLLRRDHNEQAQWENLLKRSHACIFTCAERNTHTSPDVFDEIYKAVNDCPIEERRETTNLKKHVLRHLKNAQYYRQAITGTARTPNAHDYLAWFRRFVNKKLGNEYTTRNYHRHPSPTAYNLMVMQSIIHHIDLLNTEHRLTPDDLIAGVHNLYAIYLKLSDDDQSLAPKKSIKRSLGAVLRLHKTPPKFLTNLPDSYYQLSPALSSSVRNRIHEMDVIDISRSCCRLFYRRDRKKIRLEQLHLSPKPKASARHSKRLASIELTDIATEERIRQAKTSLARV